MNFQQKKQISGPDIWLRSTVIKSWLWAAESGRRVWWTEEFLTGDETAETNNSGSFSYTINSTLSQIHSHNAFAGLASYVSPISVPEGCPSMSHGPGGWAQILQACSQNSTMRIENCPGISGTFLQLQKPLHWNSSQGFHWVQRTSE